MGKKVNHVDFSDPQGRKSSCNRKAAQIKSNVKSSVNEGHLVTNVRELKQAIESRGGILESVQQLQKCTTRA